MIRLFAQRGSKDAFIYRIEHPGGELLVTGNEARAVEHLRALGAESPELLVVQAKQWNEIEVYTPAFVEKDE
jgi:hypothetical protein